MRVTVSDIKNSSIPAAVGLAPCDARFLTLLNEAQQRLVMGPEMWWELYERYAVNVSNGKVTWPRQVASIHSIAVDDVPYRMHNEWFEFIETGYGIRDESTIGQYKLHDRGTSCLFDDIDPDDTDKKLKLYSDTAEDSGLKFVVHGYDEDGEWIRSQVSGEWVDGEYIDIPTDPATPTISTNKFSVIVNIIKPVTDGELSLFEYDYTNATQRRIGFYETDETRPRYRRTLIGGLEDVESATITAMVKRELLWLYNDNDFLIVGNMPAVKEMMMAIQKRERGNYTAAADHEAMAFRLMDREAAHYISPASVVPIRMEGSVWGVGECNYVQ